jgi:hypothetical protein
VSIGLNAAILSGVGATSSARAGSLTGQIQQDKQQLDDWTTCVSAKTTKGQAEIQRLSGALSAAEQQLHRLAASTSQASADSPTHSIDVWA